MTCLRSAVVSVVLWSFCHDAHAQALVKVSADGRTLSNPSLLNGRGDIRLVISTADSARDCLSLHPQSGGMSIRFRYSADVEQPTLLPSDAETASENGDGSYSIRAPRHNESFLMFNVWRQSTNSVEGLKDCPAKRRQIEQSLGTLAQPLDDADTELRAIATRVTGLQQDLSDITADIKAFQYVGGSAGADRVAALQDRQKSVRADLQAAEMQRQAAQTKRDGVAAKLSEAEQKYGASLSVFREITDDLSDFIVKKTADRGYFEATALKAGGLCPVPSMKCVYYDLADRSLKDRLAVSPMGVYPPVMYGDRLFIVLTNVQADSFPHPFSLDVKEQAGAVINVAPVRPVFDPGKIRAAGEAPATIEPKIAVSPDAYQDVFLPVVGTFAPNDYAEVTLTTEGVDNEGKPADIKLLDKARLPQFRAKYRYNFNTGLLHSWQRSATFTKVKIRDDDASTEKVDESSYRVAESREMLRNIPVFAFSIYPVGIDIQGPVGIERWIPAPTVGFSMTDPTKDVFLGFTNEVVRHTQVFYGVHFGQIPELVTRNDVSEEKDATAPVTRNSRSRSFSFGVTFNINLIKDIFK